MLHTRALLLSSAILLTGCAKTQTTLPASPPDAATTQPSLTSNVLERVKELQTRAAEYATGAKNLPGRNEVEDRATTGQEFALLSQIIPLVAGPEISGDLAQQLRIIDATRNQLLNGSAELSIEPTTDAGLRAAYRALSGIGTRSFADAADVTKALDLMRTRVDDLDTASGALHRLVAGQVLQASSDAISQMAANLDTRLMEKSATPAAPTTPATPKAP